MASAGRTRGLPLQAPGDDKRHQGEYRYGANDELTHRVPPPVAHPSGLGGGEPLRGVPGPNRRRQFVAGRLAATYLAVGSGTRRWLPALHRRLVLGVDETLRVVLELEQAAAAAEPVHLAVVLDRQHAGVGVDLHAADGIDLDGHREGSFV